jgi:hypothetical protein
MANVQVPQVALGSASECDSATASGSTADSAGDTADAAPLAKKQRSVLFAPYEKREKLTNRN